VADAHAAGLLVHIWTFRPENYFLAADFKGPGDEAARQEAGSLAEIGRYIQAGIDGFFTDDPAIGRRAITAAGG
jgi:glycerophosphoryl diester phosphodiesterase